MVNQQVAVAMLEKLGCRVDVANNGYEALETLARASYNLVFMDCQMPGMDGFEATSAIREREALTGNHIPIIALTSHAMPGDRERCLAAGMDDYMNKPVRTGVLQQALDHWLSYNRPCWRGFPTIWCLWTARCQGWMALKRPSPFGSAKI